jgi:hypothetical protein
MAKKKHRKLLRKTRVARRKAGKYASPAGRRALAGAGRRCSPGS